MIRRRRVVTRRQYERWNRQKLLVESLCSGGGSTTVRPSSTTSQQFGGPHNYRRVETPMPLSPLPSDDTNNVDYERLEIYDGADTPRSAHLKRRRTPSRVALYRQMDIELEEDEASSRSSSTYTGSLAHSNSFTAEMIRSHEDTATLLSEHFSESFLSERPQPIATSSRKTDRRRDRPIVSHLESTKNNHERTKGRVTPILGNTNNIYSPIKTFSPASTDVSIPVINDKKKMDMSARKPKKYSVGTSDEKNSNQVQCSEYVCCDHLTSANDIYSPINAFSPASIDVSIPFINDKKKMDMSVRTTRKYSVGTPDEKNSYQVQYSEYVCCDLLTSFFKLKNKNKKNTEGPGMSLSEERRLWRSILEGDVWDNYHQYIRNMSEIDDKNVDEIEIVPVDNDFQVSGTDNYAETDNIGMLFVTTLQTDPNNPQQPPAMSASPNGISAKIPWWKLDQWILSPKVATGQGSESRTGVVSRRTKVSTQTRKISNCTEEKTKQQHKQGVTTRQGNEHVIQLEQISIHSEQSPYRHDNEPIFLRDPRSMYLPQSQMDEERTTLTPRLSPIQQLNDNKSNVPYDRTVVTNNEDDIEYEQEMMQYHTPNHDSDNGTARPFQVYTAKLERRKDIHHQADTYETESDVNMMFPIPHFSNGVREQHMSPFLRPPQASPIVETVETDSESILSDLSEMIRQVDQRQENKDIINCEDLSQQFPPLPQLQPERTQRYNTMELPPTDEDDFYSLQNSVEENIEPVQIARKHCNKHDTGSNNDIPHVGRSLDITQFSPLAKPRTSTTEPLTHNKVTSLNPKFNDTNDRHNLATMDRKQTKEKTTERLELNCTLDANKNYTHHPSRSTLVDNDRCIRQRCRSDRGRRCDDLIDLTNIQEAAATLQRKRSKSPIRLYGDPPVMRYMDGSPIRQRSTSNTRSSPPSNELEKMVETMDSPLQKCDNDLSTLQDIFARRDDIADLLAASSPKSNHVLPDGSKIVMLKPIVNVYKIQSDDRRPDSPWWYKKNHSTGVDAKMTRQGANSTIVNLIDKPSKSPKVSLQIRTVFSVDEANLAANYGFVNPVENISSPIVAVSLDDEDSSIDDELRQLAVSEKLLRKELEEVQNRSAVRRGEIDELALKINSHDGERFVDGRLLFGIKNFESPCNSDILTSSLIDLSFIDVELETEDSLISSLPVATSYENKGMKTNDLYGVPRPHPLSTGNLKANSHAKVTLMSPLPVASAYQKIDATTNDFYQNTGKKCLPICRVNSHEATYPSETEVEAVDGKHLPSTPFRVVEDSGNFTLDVDCASPLDLPMTLSGLSQRLWNVYHGKHRSTTNDDGAGRSPGRITSTETNALYVPSLSKHNDNNQQDESRYVRPNYSSVEETHIRIGGNDYQDATYDADVLIDREPSWSTIEKLYQLSMRNDSYDCNTMKSGPSDSFENVLAERDIEQIRKNVSPRMKNCSTETSDTGDVADPLFNCIEQAQGLGASNTSPDCDSTATRSSSISSDRGNLTDIDTLEEDLSVGNTIADQSLYCALLQRSPSNKPNKTKVDNNNQFKDPQSPRLQSLLDHHKRLGLNEHTAVYNAIKKHVDNNDSKAQGIYAELVRRSRRNNQKPFINNNVPAELTSCDELNAELQRSPISSVVKRFARQSSPVKRLERLRKLHSDIKAEKSVDQETEKESHFSRRLSPARRRATKSLKRSAVLHRPKCDTQRVVPIDTRTCPTSNGVVQVFMSVTRSTKSEVRKLKKDAQAPSRDIISLASSTKSHSLVDSLPPSAKARSVASSKPGSLLWKATAGREKK